MILSILDLLANLCMYFGQIQIFCSLGLSLCLELVRVLHPGYIMSFSKYIFLFIFLNLCLLKGKSF